MIIFIRNIIIILISFLPSQTKFDNVFLIVILEVVPMYELLYSNSFIVWLFIKETI